MNAHLPDQAKTPAAVPGAVGEANRSASPGFARNILYAQRRQQVAVLAEVAKIRGFMPLLMKRRNGSAWSRAERDELFEQLRALAHISPYLFILVLPGSFVLLPMFAWWLDRRRQTRRGPAKG